MKKMALRLYADNLFNKINHQVDINILGPSFSTILQSTYGTPFKLFITGQGELSSTEGATQDNSLAMAMCALATVTF